MQFGNGNCIMDRENRLIAALDDRKNILPHTGLSGRVDIGRGCRVKPAPELGKST